MINFFEDGVSCNVKEAQQKILKSLIWGVIQDYQFELEGLNVVFVSDEELKRINWEYLKHDYYTDILSFDLSSKENMIYGELYLSLPRIQDNAEYWDVNMFNELSRVIIHGVLHLVGYQDKSDVEAERMRILEEYYLAKLK